MNNEENWSLIARHLAKSISPEEERALLTWAAEDTANQKRLDEATRIWSLTGKKLQIPEIETEKEWQALVLRIEQEEKAGGISRIYSQIPGPLRIAAIVLVASFILYLLI